MRVAVIGNGQQGLSIASALCEKHDVQCFDASEDVREQARNLSADTDISHHDNISDAVNGVDVVFLATPIDQFSGVVRGISPYLSDDTIITDIGSGKSKSIENVRSVLPDGVSYIPGHPIAGKAQSGPSASDPDMYKGQTVIVVPQEGGTSQQDVIEGLWQDMGAHVSNMDPNTHDNLYGTISHFEHVVAFSLTSLGYDQVTGGVTEDYKKGGDTLLSTTRISGGASPDMWIPIFEDNKDAVVKAADNFQSYVDELREALQEDTPAKLQALLEEAHQFRKAIPDRPREGLMAEVSDLTDEYGIKDVDLTHSGHMSGVFNEKSGISLAKRILLPTFIGAAITLNAIETEKNELQGIEIADVANPSFKDGSAPMLNNPEYVSNLLFHNKDLLLDNLNEFNVQYTQLLDTIQASDRNAMRALIDDVSEIRSSMPSPRGEDEVREEFSV